LRCGTWLLTGLVQEERDGKEGARYFRLACHRSRPEYAGEVDSYPGLSSV
jgi:hypothetical protein